jgi:hypothetical protein
VNYATFLCAKTQLGSLDGFDPGSGCLIFYSTSRLPARLRGFLRFRRLKAGESEVPALGRSWSSAQAPALSFLALVGLGG